MSNSNTIGSLNLDTSSQGAVKTSSNLTGGQKFANALHEGVDAIGDIAGNLANVFPGGGGAVLSAVASGFSGVAGSGPMGAGSSSIGGILGSVGMGGGGGYAGAMGGGGSGGMGGIGGGGGLGGIVGGGGGGAAGVSASGNAAYQQQLSMVKLQQQMQNQSQMIQLISAIINIQHQTAVAIIGNIH